MATRSLRVLGSPVLYIVIGFLTINVIYAGLEILAAADGAVNGIAIIPWEGGGVMYSSLPAYVAIELTSGVLRGILVAATIWILRRTAVSQRRFAIGSVLAIAWILLLTLRHVVIDPIWRE